MSPRALLLSPDDQAVSAITGVLEEMSVTCERPMDGASAAQKLHSQSYDLVLVDCDNLPAAKLIFDVCRRANAGTTVPIAIVDGRAGLPTAFRLGAELILTKPVAKDQARTTVRTAVSRLRKEEPVRPIKIEPTAALPAVAALEEVNVLETRAQAAAAGVECAPAKAIEVATSPAIEAPKAPPPATEIAAPSTVSSTRAELPPLSEPAPPPPIHKTRLIAPSKAQPFASEDDAVAELEKAETELASPVTAHKAPKKQKKTSGALVAVFVLCLLGGGFYAAWMTQPAFRAFVEPQVNKVLAMAATVTQRQASPSLAVPPAAKPVTPPAARKQPAATATQIASATAASDNKQGPPTSDLAKSAAAVTSAADAPSPATSTDKASAAPPESTSEKIDVPSSEAEQSWEKSTTILSSKGAEKRLVHQVPPSVPRAARNMKTEGTVVLKTLVNEDGSVGGVRLVEGDPTLAAAATKAVKQWRYKPFVRNGSRARFQTIVIVDFQQP